MNGNKASVHIHLKRGTSYSCLESAVTDCREKEYSYTSYYALSFSGLDRYRHCLYNVVLHLKGFGMDCLKTHSIYWAYK